MVEQEMLAVPTARTLNETTQQPDRRLRTGHSGVDTVRQFCEIVCAHVGLDSEKNVVSSEKFIRPPEVDHLLGDRTLTEQTLGWEPKVSFNELVTMMVDGVLAARA
jgi:GDP-D-mannose dehydratase